jgi:hypothetical protein
LTGPIVGLHETEEALAAVPGLDAIFLRPGYFYEIFFGSLPAIKQYGANGGHIAPDAPVKMVASADVGEAAAADLLDGSFRGIQVRDLYARDYTMTAVTKILGARIDKPELANMQMPDDAFVGALVGAGFGASIAGMYAEMGRAIGAGRIVSTQPRTPRTTASTSFESFAEVLAGAYRSRVNERIAVTLEDAGTMGTDEGSRAGRDSVGLGLRRSRPGAAPNARRRPTRRR